MTLSRQRTGEDTMSKLWSFMLAIGLCPLAFAEGSVNGTLTYGIHHERYGQIGTHRVAIRSGDDGQAIEITTQLAVPILFFTYSEQVRHTEIWRRGRLVSFRRTTRNGAGHGVETLAVSAWASGERLVVVGRSGRSELPGDVLSSHPWNPRLLGQTRLMLAETGELSPVVITDHGEDTVLAGGELIPTQKYELSGGLQRELWYDAHRMCVQVRLRKHGGIVTVTLQTPDSSDETAALRSALKVFLGETAEQDS